MSKSGPLFQPEDSAPAGPFDQGLFAEVAAFVTKQAEPLSKRHLRDDWMIRLALLHGDLLGDTKGLIRYSREAKDHPLGPIWMLQAAMEAGESETLDQLEAALTPPPAAKSGKAKAAKESAVDGQTDEAANVALATVSATLDGELLLALADHFFFGLGNTERAEKVYRALVQASSSTSAAASAEERLRLLLGVRGQFAELARHLAEKPRRSGRASQHETKSAGEGGAPAGAAPPAAEAPSAAIARATADALGTADGQLDSDGEKLELAGLLFDVDGDLAIARKLIEETLAENAERSLVAYGLELGQLLIVEAPARRRLLERRIVLALAEQGTGSGPPGMPGFQERAVVNFELAELVSGDDEADAANRMWALVQSDGAFGQGLALRRTLKWAHSSKDFAKLADAYRVMGRSSSIPSLARAGLRRSAEIYERRLNDRQTAETVWAELFSQDPSDRASARALERLRLARGAFADLVTAAEQHGRSLPKPKSDLAAVDEVRNRALATASLVVMAQLGKSELEPAAKWAFDIVGTLPPGEASSGQAVGRLINLGRWLRRSHDRSRLKQLYLDEAKRWQEVAAKTPSQAERLGRGIAALLAEAGALELGLGMVREAEGHLREALGRASDDLFSLVLLMATYRRANRHRELVEVLDQIIPLLSTQDARAACYRDIGRISAERLDDSARARRAFEQALAIEPTDWATLYGLAKLVGEAGEEARAVELRERAVAVCTDKGRAASMLVELAEAVERDPARAGEGQAYCERALELDPSCVGALHALAQLNRKSKKIPELLTVLRRELEVVSKPARKVALHLEIARHEDEHGTADAALGHYRAALLHEPQNAPALAGIERICRREQRWKELLDALEGVPRSSRTWQGMADAYEALGQWKELAELRKEQLESTAEPKEIARLAQVLARVYAERLSDNEPAARYYRLALELDPADPQPARALEQFYEDQQDWQEAAWAYEQELERTFDRNRRVVILARLGELYAGPIEDPSEAAGYYEQLLESDPSHLPTLRQLADIYQRTGRSGEQGRVLDQMVRATGDVSSRVAIYSRRAELAEATGDYSAALGTLREAFLADPSVRTTFTLFERIAYKQSRWQDVDWLYKEAIGRVEAGTSRAYRLSDLLVRRGQVQLQYLGQAEEAIATFLRVLEIEPDSETALKALESVYAKQSDWRALIGAYERRTELLPAVSREKRVDTLRRAIRVAAGKLKDTDETVRLYERIYALDPIDVDTLDNLERHYEQTRAFPQLIKILETRLHAAQDAMEAATLQLRIAAIYEDSVGNLDAAIDHLKGALDIDPHHKAALDALARIYEGLERWEDFIEATRKQIKVTIDRHAKALLYFKCGSVMEAKFAREDEAIRYYDAAVKTSPACMPALHGLLDVYLRRQDWRAVIQVLELESKVWQQDKERAGVLARIGQIYGDHLNDEERALEYYESALRVDADSVLANRALFDLCYRREEWARAGVLAEKIQQKAPRDGDPAQRSDFYQKWGVVARHTGDLRAAAECFVNALDIKPDHLASLESFVDLMRSHPAVYGFSNVLDQLEKRYRKDVNNAALARVLVGKALVDERNERVDEAEKELNEAFSLDGGDLFILEPLIDLQILLGRTSEARDQLNRFLARPDLPAAMIVRGQLRLAEILSDLLGDALKASAALTRLLEVAPRHREARFKLAQERYVLGDFVGAQAHCEQVIELAGAPDENTLPEEIALYYFYLGRIFEAQAKHVLAASRYRRAAEYDPALVESTLALVKRYVAQRDFPAATSLLRAGITAAAESRRAVRLLHRALAQVHTMAGERDEAIAVYRAILDGADGDDDFVQEDKPVYSLATTLDLSSAHALDRVALAEVLAQVPGDAPYAVEELQQLLGQDLQHGGAYRALASLYERMGEFERASRVLAVLDLLGMAEAHEREHLLSLRKRLGAALGTRTIPLGDSERLELMVPEECGGPLLEAFFAVREVLVPRFAAGYLGEKPAPLGAPQDDRVLGLFRIVGKLFGLEARILVADHVPGGVLAMELPQPTVVVDRQFLKATDGEWKFLLGRALDPLRFGYAMLLRLGPTERRQVSVALGDLLTAGGPRDPFTAELLKGVPRRSQKLIEKLPRVDLVPDPERWFAALNQAADRAGLFACDDVQAAARMLTLLGGSASDMVPVNEEHTGVALGAITGGADLVRYFMSDAYHELQTSRNGKPTT